jgi:hypothetical protein
MHTQLVADLEASYTNPISSRDYWPYEGQYCVGGALTHAYGFKGKNPKMPRTGTLASTICKLTPSQRHPYNYALAILRYNDAGRFAEAWDLLDQALAGEPAPDDLLPASGKMPASKEPY